MLPGFKEINKVGFIENITKGRFHKVIYALPLIFAH
jgi:hypothetical protein